jgi:hypothetical protein
MQGMAGPPAKQIASHGAAWPYGLKQGYAQPSQNHFRHDIPEKRPYSTRRHFHGRYGKRAKNDSCERQPKVSTAEIGADDRPERIFAMMKHRPSPGQSVLASHRHGSNQKL